MQEELYKQPLPSLRHSNSPSFSGSVTPVAGSRFFGITDEIRPEVTTYKIGKLIGSLTFLWARMSVCRLVGLSARLLIGQSFSRLVGRSVIIFLKGLYLSYCLSLDFFAYNFLLIKWTIDDIPFDWIEYLYKQQCPSVCLGKGLRKLIPLSRLITFSYLALGALVLLTTFLWSNEQKDILFDCI